MYGSLESAIVKGAGARARELLKRHRPFLDALADALVSREALAERDVSRIYRDYVEEARARRT